MCRGYPIPGRTIRLITPHGAGSGADILARLVGPKLAERWKVTAVTDNRTGASGDIGIVAAAGAEPDGYTLLCVATVFTINPVHEEESALRSREELRAGVAAGDQRALAAGAPSLPAKTFPEFVDLARKRSRAR